MGSGGAVAMHARPNSPRASSRPRSRPPSRPPSRPLSRLSLPRHPSPPASPTTPPPPAPATPPSPTPSQDALKTDATEQTSIRLQYPRSSRLLLGTTTNIAQPGFLKALETKYPLEISLECHALTPPQTLFTRFSRPAPRPFALFFYRAASEAPWELIGRTETVAHDLYHRFVTKLKVCCATLTDRMKLIRVEIYDHRSKSDLPEHQLFIGSAQCTLDDIISEPLLRKELRLESARTAEPGVAVLSADAIRPMVTPIQFSLHVDMASITKGHHRVFYVLSRQLQSGDYTPVYRSEVLKREQKRFRAVTRDLSAVTAGVEDKLLRLELFQYVARGPHVKLGFMQTSIDKLRGVRTNSRLLWWPATSCDGDTVIEVGRVVVIECNISERNMMFRLRVTQ